MKEQEAPPPDLAYVRQQIQRVKRELAVWETAEQGLLAAKAGESSGLKGAFQNMRPYDAICDFLKRQGEPQTRLPSPRQ